MKHPYYIICYYIDGRFIGQLSSYTESEPDDVTISELALEKNINYDRTFVQKIG